MQILRNAFENAPDGAHSPLVLGRGGSWAPSPPGQACPASPSHLLAPHEVMQAPEPELRGQGEGGKAGAW